MPGVQKPHWLPWCLSTASCTGCSAPSGPARSSTATSSLPSIMPSRQMQALTGAYSSLPSCKVPSATVQAPQSPSAQPSLVPQAWRRSRR